MKVLIAAFILLASSQAFADGSDTIIETRSNDIGPAGKSIEVKNVDLHRFDFFPQEGGPTITSYSLTVYLWVNQDLGGQTNAITLVDANDPTLQSFDREFATRVGFDQATKDFVYEVRMPVDTRASDNTSAFYAALNLDGIIHYSNEDQPNSYFIFPANQK